MVNRMIEPTSGTISLDGRDTARMDAAELRRGMGYVIQHAGLFPHRTVLDNVGTVPRLLGWDRKRTAQRAPWSCSSGSASTRLAKRYPAPALRRPAAARRRRPRARGRPAGDAHGRALLGRRPGRARAAPGRVPAPAGRARQDHPLRHPRHRRGRSSSATRWPSCASAACSRSWPRRPTCSPTRSTTSSPASSAATAATARCRFRGRPGPLAHHRAAPSRSAPPPATCARSVTPWVLVVDDAGEPLGLGRAAAVESEVTRDDAAPRRHRRPRPPARCAPPRRRPVLAERSGRRRRRRRRASPAPSAPHEVLTAIEAVARPEAERPGPRRSAAP